MRTIVSIYFLVLAFLQCSSSFAAGRQLTGVYSPAPTPALSPEEAAKKMTLPEGFEARIFAFEPQVVNPVAMTWDDRGRLWVAQLYAHVFVEEHVRHRLGTERGVGAGGELRVVAGGAELHRDGDGGRRASEWLCRARPAWGRDVVL